MGLRDALNDASPVVRSGVTIVVVACAAFFVYLATRPDPERVLPTVEAGDMTTIRCKGCQYTTQRSTAELVSGGQIDPLEHVALLGDARACPKCGSPALEVVEKQSQLSGKR